MLHLNVRDNNDSV